MKVEQEIIDLYNLRVRNFRQYKMRPYNQVTYEQDLRNLTLNKKLLDVDYDFAFRSMLIAMLQHRIKIYENHR